MSACCVTTSLRSDVLRVSPMSVAWRVRLSNFAALYMIQLLPALLTLSRSANGCSP